MTDPVSALEAHVEAFNDRDLAALMAGFTDDAAWITGTTTVRGSAELADLFEGALRGLLPTLTLDNVIASGDQAAAQLTETLTADGAEHTFAIAGFYRFRDGRISAAKIYREGSAEI
ncbi:nuclear transport factor 2 family protein [Amycolatopsis sp. ATCC 39116]|uniref:nuclear transport factor 2 family protein n=1 Tax=Amycolatopsis sp. (strain ATCC 39116 / 75iv2) TaxID=385957 RepID=UPI0002628611|nr:nuclear transport factor 2 family protein [Amycolatopsis sp. ATCC 39116]